MIARLDGRSFTRLTKERYDFETPFDFRFHEIMLQTAEHLAVSCGLGIAYAYTQSDELSLLFDRDSDPFGRSLRKLLSILAGETSAKFSLLLGAVAAFDCRISQLPSKSHVIDYFRWRNEDAHRNALNAHCFWMLHKKGVSIADATTSVSGLSVAEKNELLFQNSVNFNDLPLWQKRGSGLYWENFGRTAVNPVSGVEVVAQRRRLRRNLELPMKDDYSTFLANLLDKSQMNHQSPFP